MAESGTRWSHRRPRRIETIGLAVAQVIVILVGSTAVATGAVGSGDERCPGVGDRDERAKAILDCLRPSTAYVRTLTSFGTGLVLPDGHVVTNAHVVDPHDVATVVIEGVRYDDVALVGVDLVADVAVLGPIDGAVAPIEVGDPATLVQGDELFLVGFPGELEESPEPAISRGILSRVREQERWDLTFLQTDASIGGGQSGGALVDATGRVVGVSGLIFAENFALALQMSDVRASVDDILDGDGDRLRTWPTESDGSSTIDVLAGHRQMPTVLAVPGADEERAVDVDVDGPESFLLVHSSDGLELGVSANFVRYTDQLADDLAGVPGLEGADINSFAPRGPGIVTERGPNQYTVNVPAKGLVVLTLFSEAVDDVPTTITTSVPVRELPQPLSPREVSVGDSIDASLDALEPFDNYRVRLDEGQRVRIYAGSPAADLIVAVRAPSQGWHEATISDDSDGGLYGLDAELTYTAPETGFYDIEVGKFDPSATAYVFEVQSVES